MLKLGVIGAAGRMATAILDGIVAQGALQPGEIAVAGRSPEKLEPYGARGMRIYPDNASLVADCHYVLLSVEPQVMDQVLRQIAPSVGPDTVLISVAAGITAEAIRAAVGFGCKVVLAMPNTPVMVGCGSTALARIEPISDEEFAFARGLFACSGLAETVPADLLCEISPVNGSSPAAIYQSAKIVCGHAASLGIDPEAARRLFCAALIGAAQMMLQTGRDFDDLTDEVCSPGGSTLKMLEALEQNQFGRTLTGAMDASIRRAHELGGGAAGGRKG